MKSWLQDSYVKMYLAHNDGKSVFAKRLIRALNNKTFKYMTSISKNMYIDKLDDITDKCNNEYYKTIIMKLLMLI